MCFVLHPWQLLVGILAGWMNQRQQEAIDYLRTENQVLRETLGQSHYHRERNHRGLEDQIITPAKWSAGSLGRFSAGSDWEGC